MKDWQRWKDNYKVISFRMHKVKDGDIIKRLGEISNKQGYIKDLIRKDINDGNKTI